MKRTRLSFLAAACLVSACSSGTNDRDADAGVELDAASPTDTEPSSPTDVTQTDEDGSETDDGAAADRDASAPDMSSDDGSLPAPGPDPDESRVDAGTPPTGDRDGSMGPSADAGSADGVDAAPVPPEPPPCGGACVDGEVCDLATDECVECVGDQHCDEGTECRANVCEPIVPCEEAAECTDELPVCHSQLDRCVECEIDLDCPVDYVCSARTCVDSSQQCLMGDDPCSSGAVLPMTQSQVIDGLGDEFCDLPGFELNFDNAARGNADLPHSVVARVGWSEQAFHLYAQVEDPELASNPELDYLWSGDVVELFLATGPADELAGFFSGRIDGVQLVFAPPTNELAARAARLFWLPSEDNPDTYVQVREPLSTGFAARVTATGYAIEAAIPWSSFGPRTPDIGSGSQIAFNLGLSTANAQSIGNPNDGRQGSATLYVGGGVEGVNTCQGEQLPWCNSTTWCSPELQ